MLKFEKSMLKERTKAGLDAAREEGRIGGRRPKLSPQQQAEICGLQQLMRNYIDYCENHSDSCEGLTPSYRTFG